jgi:NMD protein affecting ribosome stability and mRNA decay
MLCSECERLRSAMSWVSADCRTAHGEYQRVITQSFAIGHFPGRELDEAAKRVEKANKLRSNLSVQIDAHMTTHLKS